MVNARWVFRCGGNGLTGESLLRQIAADLKNLEKIIRLFRAMQSGYIKNFLKTVKRLRARGLLVIDCPYSGFAYAGGQRFSPTLRVAEVTCNGPCFAL
jgi:hypothetical protein